MADVAIQNVPAAGLAGLTMNAAAASQTVPARTPSAPGSVAAGGWFESVLVAVVRNADASSHDVTIGSLAAVTVAAGAIAVIPVPNPGVNGAQQNITWSATTSMTIGLGRIGVGY
jgi:hypothetical protein